MLYRGKRGNAVAVLQAYLNKVVKTPPLLKVDGVYGPFTYARVVKFQRRFHNLRTDGVFGPKTETELLKQIKKINKSLMRTKVPPVTTKTSSAKPRQKSPGQMSRAEMETLLKSSFKDFNKIQAKMGASGFSNFLWWASKTRDVAEVIDSFDGIEKLVSLTRFGAGTAADILSGATGMLGIAFFFYDVATEIIRISDDQIKAYAMRARAYAVTTWVFDKPQVKKSQVRSSLASDAKKEDEAWLNATGETYGKLGAMQTIGGLPPAKFKRVIRILYKNDASAFCKDIMKSMTKKVPAGPQRTAWESTIKDWGDNIVYPK